MTSSPDFYQITLPLYTGGTRRQLKDGTFKKATKKYWLSMNNYRNWCGQSSNNQKKRFKALVESQVEALPDLSFLWGEVAIHYFFFPPNRTARDIGNYVAVVDKFFCDTVVEAGKLEDDNMFILKRSTWEMGEIDKENPRMEAFITPYVPTNILSKLKDQEA